MLREVFLGTFIYFGEWTDPNRKCFECLGGNRAISTGMPDRCDDWYGCGKGSVGKGTKQPVSTTPSTIPAERKIRDGTRYTIPSAIFLFPNPQWALGPFW